MATKSLFDRPFTRRDAVRLGLYGLGMTAGFPRFLQHTALAPAAEDQSSVKAKSTGRILVVVELTGGNDGINTIIPFGFIWSISFSGTCGAAAVMSTRSKGA